jgi:hypothetical protein
VPPIREPGNGRDLGPQRQTEHRAKPGPRVERMRNRVDAHGRAHLAEHGHQLPAHVAQDLAQADETDARPARQRHRVQPCRVP